MNSGRLHRVRSIKSNRYVWRVIGVYITLARYYVQFRGGRFRDGVVRVTGGGLRSSCESVAILSVLKRLEYITIELDILDVVEAVV